MKKPAAQLVPGTIFDVSFRPNQRADSRFPFVGVRPANVECNKAILCRDRRVEAGSRYQVRVTSVSRPGTKGRGGIVVEVVSKAIQLGCDDLWIDPLLETKLLGLHEAGRDILLDGPQGCGKTRISRRLAEVLGLEFVFFNCASVYEPTDFLATPQVRGTPSGGTELSWIKTDILRALYTANEYPKRRFLVMLDELNRMRPLARNGVMSGLDDTVGVLWNPVTGTNIPVPPNVSWIAAINRGFQFSGTTDIDPAQLDRWSPLHVAYPPLAEEIRFLRNRYPKTPRRQIRRLVEAADAIRNDEGYPRELSVRATEEVAALLSLSRTGNLGRDPLPEILKTSYCGRFGGRWDQQDTEAGQVWHIIRRTLRMEAQIDKGAADDADKFPF